MNLIKVKFRKKINLLRIQIKNDKLKLRKILNNGMIFGHKSLRINYSLNMNVNRN